MAKETFQPVAIKNKWALYGLAEACYELGELDESRYREIREAAISEYVRREEPRTKVLARTTELVCCVRVPSLKKETAAIYSQVVEALGRVDGRLTVYSQIQRRNVRKDELQEDLDSLMDEALGAGPAATPSR